MGKLFYARTNEEQDPRPADSSEPAAVLTRATVDS